MAHEVYQLEDGSYSMAYVGDEPWHGLGQKLNPDSPMEVWCKEANLDWSVIAKPVLFNAGVPGSMDIKTVPNRMVLVRDDNGSPLSVVSNRYNIVQPRQVLEFYKELIENSGFRMDTAGSLRGGLRVWALVKIPENYLLGGIDPINGYALLTTSYDGTLATTAQLTAVRVVCNNTLTLAYQQGVAGKERKVSVPHFTNFTVEAQDRMKAELGLFHEGWAAQMINADKLARTKMTNKDAAEFIMSIFGVTTDKPLDEQANVRTVAKVIRLFEGEGMGANLDTARGTAWGVVNSFTQYIDHSRGRNPNTRMDAAWNGIGAAMKQRVWTEALKLAA